MEMKLVIWANKIPDGCFLIPEQIEKRKMKEKRYMAKGQRTKHPSLLVLLPFFPQFGQRPPTVRWHKLSHIRKFYDLLFLLHPFKTQIPASRPKFLSQSPNTSIKAKIKTLRLKFKFTGIQSHLKAQILALRLNSQPKSRSKISWIKAQILAWKFKSQS